MRSIKVIFIFFLALIWSLPSFSYKVSGVIRDAEGERLPFATIYVEEISFGTTSNLEGYYEIELNEGAYTFIIQFLGYETLTEKIELDASDRVLNITLQPRSYILPNLVYKAGSEDPAYAIMRKVIAKSKYHMYQLKSYKTEVYVKGSGRLVKAPFFLRNRLKKEGIDSSRVFMVESLSEIQFDLPNTYTQRVISVNTTGDENSPDPMPFIQASFYQPRIAGALSPISPQAFSHYNFRYDGFFRDGPVIVNKIHVEPKIKGDIVFDGDLYIIEGLWAIHSLDFNTFYQGFEVNINQVYRAVGPEVWMPVTHRFNVEGSFMGFDLEFKYVAVNNNYEIVLNDQLIQPDSLADSMPAPDSLRKESVKPVATDLNQKKELTKKDIRKMIRESEVQALKEVERDPDVLYRENIFIDSTAYEKDSAFWADIRPIPLSFRESNSLAFKDSLKDIRMEEKKKDSIRDEKNKHFRIYHILTGNDYQLSERSDLTWRPLWNKFSFNTVEGWNLNFGIDYKFTIDSSHNFTLGSTARYGFSSKQWYGFMYARYHFGQHLRMGELEISGGKYIYQINRDNPIPYWLNMVGSLFFRENFMKLYESGFLNIKLEKPLSPAMELRLDASWEKKYALNNQTDYSFTGQNKEYSPNNPANILLGETEFDPYTLYSSNIILNYYPFLKFFERNGERSIVEESSPVLSFGYFLGISGNDTNRFIFQKVQAGIRYGRTFGVGNRIEMYFAGSRFFIHEGNLPFPEFDHFYGNRTPLITGPLYTSYRMLDYYFYSTNKYYIESHLLYQFRKLLITQIIYTRLAGIREDLMIHYLYTNSMENYIELAYALDNLFRLFRLEVIGQFENFEYKGLGFRIGFSKNISFE